MCSANRRTILDAFVQESNDPSFDGANTIIFGLENISEMAVCQGGLNYANGENNV